MAAALRDPASFSSAEGVTYPRIPLGMMLTTDPPLHTRLRRVVSRHFTPSAVEARRAHLSRRVEEFALPMIERGHGDVVEDLAAPMPTAVIADLLGVEASDRADFRRWSDEVVEGFNVGAELEAESIMAASRGFAGLGGYLQTAIEERRRQAGDDLVTLLVQAADEERLTAGELTSFAVLLLIAGNETTTNLLGSLGPTLIEEPDAWRALKEDPPLVGSAVEETLRYRAPIQGLYRTATREMTFGDVTIPERARVLVLYAAANRDPARYPDPDRFDVRRNPTDHLGFGAGIHFCLGASLARAETTLALSLLVERVTDIALAGPVVMRNNPNLYGPASLPVTFAR